MESDVTEDYRLEVFRNIGLQLTELRHLQVPNTRETDFTEDHRSPIKKQKPVVYMFQCSVVAHT